MYPDQRDLIKRSPLIVVLYVINSTIADRTTGNIGIDKRTLKILDEVLKKLSDQGYKELFRNYKEWLAEIINEANQSEHGGYGYLFYKLIGIHSALQSLEGASRTNTQYWIMKLIQEVKIKTPVGIFGVSKKHYQDWTEAELSAAENIGYHRYV